MFSSNFLSAVVYLCLIWCVSCHVQAKEPNLLVGSIPGDSAAKQMLGIDASENVDFIRLRIALNEGDRNFELNASYGIGKPNTRNFENGGKTMSAKGQLEITDKGGYLAYRLLDGAKGVDLSLIRLNDNLFHVLSQDGRLMSGNGGWNYTLSRETELKSKRTSLSVGKKTSIVNDPETLVFVGRTPCVEIAREQRISVTDDCFKLKWKLTLHQAPDSKSASKFLLQRTFRRSEPVKGTWRTVRDGNSVIYRLEGDDGSNVSFLRLDDSLLFLDKASQLLKGNAEFGYTLDRKKDPADTELQKAKMK